MQNSSLELKFLKLKSLIPASFLQETNANLWPAKKDKKISKNDKKFLLKTRGKQDFAPQTCHGSHGSKTDKLKTDEVKTIRQDMDMNQPELNESREKEINLQFNIRQPVTRIGKKIHLKHVLQKLEKGKGKREILKKENLEKFLQEKKDYEFRKAELKLNSCKVQDDAKLLKKSMARIQSRKKKSELEWKKRIKTQESTQVKKQKKRMENLKRKRPGFK